LAHACLWPWACAARFPAHLGAHEPERTEGRAIGAVNKCASRLALPSLRVRGRRSLARTGAFAQWTVHRRSEYGSPSAPECGLALRCSRLLHLAEFQRKFHVSLFRSHHCQRGT
jgi:hypothetical protein